MSRPLKFLGALAAASAASYLALLAAWLVVFQGPRLLLAAFTPVEFFRFQPRWALPTAVTTFPPDGSAALYTLYNGGFLLVGSAALWLGTRLARRAGGWLRLVLAQSVVWTGVILSAFAAAYVGWAAGPVEASARAVSPAQADGLPLRITFGALLAVIVLPAGQRAAGTLMAAGDPMRTRAAALARWVLLPAAIVSVALTAPWYSWASSLRWGIGLGALLLTLVCSLPALRAGNLPSSPWRVSLTGALVVVGLTALAVAFQLEYRHLVRLASRSDFEILLSRHWILHFDKDAVANNARSSFAAAADQRLDRMAAQLGLTPPAPLLDAYVYASPDRLEAFAGSSEPLLLDAGDRAVHHLLTPTGAVSDERGEALLVMRVAWGEPGSEEVARAMARYAWFDFHGYPLEAYAARISCEEGEYSLRQILDLDHEYLSPLVRDALAGFWVSRLVGRHGRGVLPRLYRARLGHEAETELARALDALWATLEEEWKAALLSNCRPGETIPEPRPRPAFFHRGVSFSHEGGGWGYGSDRATLELTKIRQLGANAIAVVPYAFAPTPRAAEIYFATDESDDRVIRTLEAARQLGLHTLLKPQLWGREFTGHIRFDSDAEFKKWFARYRRWMLHFARLAELYDVDVLVIGTELGGVTQHEAAWRALIADLRRVYHGSLTYAAHWDAEFETLAFWDALDFLGVNMYYPLAAAGEAPRADSPRLQALVRKFAALAAKYRKPVLFTEVGFPAVSTAATEPWVEPGALDLEAQRRCYETVFQAFYGQPWFAGLYWWKWPSHGGGSRFDASFNPLGKPALDVVARWYAPPRAREKLAGDPKRGIIIQPYEEGR